MALLGSITNPARRSARLRIVETKQLATGLHRALPTAQLAECTCPEFCERDHDNE